MNFASDEAVLIELKTTLAQAGIRGALAFLNAQTPHRFTSLYQFVGETLHNVTFYDREHPEVESSEDIPVAASYCVFVRDSSAKFLIHHAAQDERVLGHPKRATVQCYCGVPLLDGDGKMFGTICHFDFKPGRVAERDVALLESMAALLQRKPPLAA